MLFVLFMVYSLRDMDQRFSSPSMLAAKDCASDVRISCMGLWTVTDSYWTISVSLDNEYFKVF